MIGGTNPTKIESVWRKTHIEVSTPKWTNPWEILSKLWPTFIGRFIEGQCSRLDSSPNIMIQSQYEISLKIILKKSLRIVEYKDQMILTPSYVRMMMSHILKRLTICTYSTTKEPYVPILDWHHIAINKKWNPQLQIVLWHFSFLFLQIFKIEGHSYPTEYNPTIKRESMCDINTHYSKLKYFSFLFELFLCNFFENTFIVSFIGKKKF